MADNKVMFGLKNVHYALVTETTDSTTGVISTTYGSPKAWPGAVSLSLDPEGDTNKFYADDTVYYTLTSNAGYSGDFECAVIPEDVAVDLLGQTEDSKGGILETDKDVQAYFALLYEIDGDAKARRFVNYKCQLSRPSVGGETKEDTTEPKTQTATITSLPRADVYTDSNQVEKHFIKYSMGPDGDSTVYGNWYTAVQTPTFL